MAKITSVAGATSITYTIIDQQGNTATVVAPIGVQSAMVTSVSTSGLLYDGLELLTTLLNMLYTGLRPNAIVNAPASFSN